MEGHVERVVQVLEATPGVLCAWLSGLDHDLVTADYGPSTFSPYNVLGHLIIGEKTDWIPRARIIFAHGESRPFDPFPHEATIEPLSGRTVGELLSEFATLRAANLAGLRGMDLSEAGLARRGTHPAFGPVTFGELVWTWAAHDLHHIAQIAKGLAHQCREGVGPWREYLGILKRP